jgi:hypothetical protein
MDKLDKWPENRFQAAEPQRIFTCLTCQYDLS